MNKIKIVLHCLPNELDQINWIIDQLKRSFAYIGESKFIWRVLCYQQVFKGFF